MLNVETCNDGRGVSASTSLARVIWYVILIFLYMILVYLFDVANKILITAGVVEINLAFYNAKIL